ncbi:hypothetical protein [Desulfovibrio falkowii]|uniref:hypothetical protein n=1 Tax=Desulfovibrio sp. WGS1351 TaxID=3366814 RepID=UPI00372D3E5D
MTNETALYQLITEIEYIIGNSCYNGSSYNGFTGEQGAHFRYPVWAVTEYNEYDGDEKERFYGRVREIPAENLKSMHYKFGANSLYIGRAIFKVLRMLEERYGLDFSELEKQIPTKS